MFQPGSRLGRYEIRSLLGVGGMGEVYLAHDAQLQRPVALKVLAGSVSDEARQVEDLSLEEVEKDVFIPFVHRPLSRYVNAMAAADLLVHRMEEPAPPPGFLALAHEYKESATIPRLLFLRAEKSR